MFFNGDLVSEFFMLWSYLGSTSLTEDIFQENIIFQCLCSFTKIFSNNQTNGGNSGFLKNIFQHLFGFRKIKYFPKEENSLKYVMNI